MTPLLVAWVPVISALAGVLVAASLAMVVVGLLAFRRSGRARFAIVTFAFAVLLGRAAWTLYAMHSGHTWESIVGLGSIGDAAMVALLYFAAVR